MSWLEWLKNFWTYSKSERRGVLLLIGVILVVYSTPYVLSFFEEKAEPNSRAFQEEISRFQEELAKKRKQAPENKSKRRDLKRRSF
ncbi:MAG: hypothetical protein BRD50_06910 [Bacteroidetes bacterium SW_11_45_7]|nr:MAG: hypothetical protein BRD50_06910 [Bacteroidetes bacterium SW_11_45_7]